MKSIARTLAVALGVLLLTFCSAPQPAHASTSGWDAGNIMSDGVMSNKNSLSQSQIQSFLESKNSCNKSVASTGGNVIGDSATQAHWVSNPSIKYQIIGGQAGTTKGTFRCMANGNFDGSSAASIIYDAAQDYNINPKVLIVLLQKESSLVTDQWPNSSQYRVATGYGCPDNGPNNTANCDANYYGFRNQVRLAASLFNSVLTGGWSNYPVGNNYVKYHPNSSCGGKTINIKNRATSALYRYTPYQPNSATLARSWPVTAPYPSCGAYGNLNFYGQFRSWFGSTRVSGLQFQSINESRYLRLTKDLRKTNLNNGEPVGAVLESGMEIYFSSRYTYAGELYVRTRYDTERGLERGIKYSDLENITPVYEAMSIPRWMKVDISDTKVEPVTQSPLGEIVRKGTHLYFVDKTTIGGRVFLRTKYNSQHDHDRVIPIDNLDNIASKYERLNKSRKLYLNEDVRKKNPITDAEHGILLESGRVIPFSSKILINNEWMLRTSYDTKRGLNLTIPYSSTSPALKFNDMNKSRYLRLDEDLRKTNLRTGEPDGALLSKGMKILFTSRYTYNGELYVRTSHDTVNQLERGIPYSKLSNL